MKTLYTVCRACAKLGFMNGRTGTRSRSARIGTALCALLASISVHADDAFGGTHCRESALGQLADWGSTGEFLLSSNSTDALRVFRSPTGKVGKWVVVTIDAGRIERLLYVTSEAETEALFDAECAIATTERPREMPDDGRRSLTDEDVARIVGSGERGVFYAWSPHMPLSVEGYAEIANATGRLGLALTAVLSSHANIDYARDRAERVGIPEDAFALNRSIELTMRDLDVHSPAILIYANGEFVSPVIPGFRRAADYQSLILRFLGD